MALSFQFATEADIPMLLKLRLVVDADQARRFGNNRWFTMISEKSVARGLKFSRVLVARRHGRIIGALRMETKKPWAIDLTYFTPVAKAVYFHDVNVEPRLQRSGVGRQLIERAKALAREWSVNAIRLDAYDGPSGGGAFYEKCGFTEVGRTAYRGVPLVYFEFILSGGFHREPETDDAGKDVPGTDQRAELHTGLCPNHELPAASGNALSDAAPP
jgi:GNAT superfamily N-acetyltransferase